MNKEEIKNIIIEAIKNKNYIQTTDDYNYNNEWYEKYLQYDEFNQCSEEEYEQIYKKNFDKNTIERVTFDDGFPVETEKIDYKYFSRGLFSITRVISWETLKKLTDEEIKDFVEWIYNSHNEYFGLKIEKKAIVYLNEFELDILQRCCYKYNLNAEINKTGEGYHIVIATVTKSELEKILYFVDKQVDGYKIKPKLQQVWDNIFGK